MFSISKKYLGKGEWRETSWRHIFKISKTKFYKDDLD